MPQRFLRPGITTSEAWNQCSFGAQSLYIRLLTVVDDYGRYDGRAAVVWGHCFALRKDISISKTQALLDELNERGMIDIYTVDEKQFLRLLKWQERTRGASKYPAPPNEDRAGEPVGSIYFIKSGKNDRVKIGFTQFIPEERLRRLQVGSSERLELLGTIEGTLREERALHRQFAVDNVGGEWFILSSAIVEYIRSKCAQSAGDTQQKTLPSPSPSPSPVHQRHSTNGSQEPNVPDDNVWREGLLKDPAYLHINISAEFSKMKRWCEVNKKQPTRKRFINWLNRIEPAMQERESARSSRGKIIPAKRPADLTDEQIAKNKSVIGPLMADLTAKLTGQVGNPS